MLNATREALDEFWRLAPAAAPDDFVQSYVESLGGRRLSLIRLIDSPAR